MSRSPAGRAYYDMKGKVLVEDFSGAADATANVTAEVTDTVNVRSGSASRKFTGTILKADYLFTSQPIGIGFGLWIHVPAGATYTSLLIYIANDSGSFGAGNWANLTYTLKDGPETSTDGASAKPGWNWIALNASDFSSTDPSMPYGNIDTIRVQINGGPHTITLDGLYLNCRSRAKCVVAFDDARDTVMGTDVQDYMSDRDIKGSIYVVKNLVDATNYVSTAHLEDLYTNDGWDVGNHLTDHTDPTAMTDAAYLSSLLECTAFLNSNGWTRGAYHHAYPTGEFERGNHDVVCENNGFKTARSIQTTIINYHNTEPYNLFYLWSKGVVAAITAQDLIDQLDKAIEFGQTCMFYFHALGAVADDPSKTWELSKFQEVMDYLDARQNDGLIDSLTISQWYDGLENGTPRSGA